MDLDWQNSLTEIRDRGQYLLHSEKLTDCRFLVGTPPKQRLLAMASPVFERMFFGYLPDKTDPIIIPDVQPEAFVAMLEYIYTDRITIGSFGKACEMCYVAKKYMLPHVVTRCTHFLWADLSPKTACRAYEFAKFFDDSLLMQSSMDLIAANTREVLSDPSFLNIEVSTLMAILDQHRLNIDSELDLFNCLLKFTSSLEQQDAADSNANVAPSSSKSNANLSASAAHDVASGNPNNEINAAEAADNMMVEQRTIVDGPMLRQAVKKIRFLTMTPQQFAKGPARSKLLEQHEAFSILIKISNPDLNDCNMPEGFCVSRSARNFSLSTSVGVGAGGTGNNASTISARVLGTAARSTIGVPLDLAATHMHHDMTPIHQIGAIDFSFSSFFLDCVKYTLTYMFFECFFFKLFK